MRKILYFAFVLCLVACNGGKPKDTGAASMQGQSASATPLSFVGHWENAGVNDTVQNLSLRIGERNDSLFISFYWERKEPFYMTGNPLTDSHGAVIPQVCVPLPKSGNRVAGTIVNQYFSVFQNYPENEYYPIVFELKSPDTLTFKICGNVNYWPDSALLVRKSSENQAYSTEIVDLYKRPNLVPDADVGGVNKFDVSGIEPSPFIGKWKWVENDSWQNFGIDIGGRGDSLLIAAGGVFLGGSRIQMPERDEEGRILPQAFLLMPKSGNKAAGRFSCSEIPYDASCNVILELFSDNTLLFRTEKPVGCWPDSAVMVRKNRDNPIFR